MTAAQQRAQAIFNRLNQELAKLRSRPTPRAVHAFRTTARRFEVLVEELGPGGGRKERRGLARLSRLRKKAGKLRDLDVQVSLLRNFKMPEGARHKLQLIEALHEERTRREERFSDAAGKIGWHDLRKRLKKAMESIDLPEAETWGRARGLLDKLNQEENPGSEDGLHRYRILGKRVRYLAECAGNHAQARHVVKQLKRMQNAMGEWHDWCKLSKRAENLLGSASGSPLLAALRNVTRAKFRLAVLASSEIPKGLAETNMAPPAHRKAAATAGRQNTAAA